MAPPRLVLVDGMAVLYRAFYAIRDLSTKAGRPTNAVYGFIRMVRQIVELWQPSHLGVVFDGGLPEARTEVLPEYKAQRAPMPDPLRAQIGTAEEYMDLSGIAWVRVAGCEADDVLASVTAWAHPMAEQVLIATGDKDLYQLVDDKVKIVSVSGKSEMMGDKEVRDKTGVSPSRIVEWLALIGDASDNIPGIAGVGPKTAAKLLAQFGSLDELWSGLDGVANRKLRQSLEEGRDLVARNMGIVRLDKGMKCPFDWERLALKSPDSSKLLPFYEELEFDSLAEELRTPSLF